MPGIGIGLGIEAEETYCEQIDAAVGVFLLRFRGGRHGKTGTTYLVGCTGLKTCRAPCTEDGLRRWALQVVGCPLLAVPSLHFRGEAHHCRRPGGQAA